jgi:hypothetical protein
MKKLFLLFIVTLVITSFAQDDKKTFSNYYSAGGTGYFIIGCGTIDFSNLNQELWVHYYPEINQNFYSFGGGGHFQINRIIIGGEGQALLRSENSNNTYTTIGNGGYGFLNVGYIVYQNKRLSLYPLVGIGGGGYSIDISKNTITPNINNLMQGDLNQMHLSSSNILLNLSIGTDYFFLGKPQENGIDGFTIGFRIGYTLDLLNTWSTEIQNISMMPNSNLGGPYVKLVIGGGGMRK